MSARGEQPAKATPPPLAADAPLRVILVGRTGLDAALRLDTAIELIRARTAMEALGELADPIDESSPDDVAVVVGADASLGDYAADFVDGLRLIEPDVRVYASAELTAPHDGEMDGTIDPRLPADVIRRAVRGHRDGSASAASAPPLRRQPGVNGRHGHSAGETRQPPPSSHGLVADLAGDLQRDGDEQAPSDAAPPRAAAPAAVDSDAAPAALPPENPPAQERALRPTGEAPAEEDEAGAEAAPAPDERSVIDAMLTGGDVLEAALEVVRHETGAHDVVFVPGEADHPPPLIGAKVTYRNRTLGTLRSVHASRAELARHADWIARWIILRDQHNQLRTAAMTDELTGAYNRRYFTRFLAAAMDQARRSRTGVTLLAFDIDDFKVYNDRYGHQAGDEILLEVVRLLKSVIRPTDRVCRVGGDEFVVIFHEPEGPREPDSKPPGSIFEIAKRFQRQVCEHHFPKLLEDAPGTLTISGGLATYPWDGRTADELLDRADQLALESKRQGKNAITLGPGAQRVCGVWD